MWPLKGTVCPSDSICPASDIRKPAIVVYPSETGKFIFKPAIKVADGETAVEQIAAVGLRVDLLVDLFVVLVRNVADDLFEQVLERDYALDAAVLVDDKAEMKFLLLHLPQHILEPGRIDNIIRACESRRRA